MTLVSAFGQESTELAQAPESGVIPAPDAPRPLSPAESLARVKLPPGFSMSLVASEPQVQDPSGIAFDEWGRLFVCELHGYNIEGHLDVEELNRKGELDKEVRRIRWEFMGGKIAEEAAKRQFGVVKLLSDRDGNGLMDHAEVWADDLPPCYGLIAARGGIIAVCAPDIVFLADRDHDGKVDFRETLFTGFKVRTLERGINNPRFGFDNWIYVGGGGEGGTITGPRLKDPVSLGSMDFRIKADGSAIEPVTGRVGTFGMTLNRIGDRFPSSGGTPAIYALPIPFRYLKRNPYVASPEMNYRASDYNRGFRLSEPHPWRVRRQQDPAWVKFCGERETDSNYFSGGCSTEYYGGGTFPKEYTDNLFYCEPSLNIVHRTVLARDNNGYRATRAPEELKSEFLASTDQWFRPMSLRFGPDGSLYIVDMYREIIEDYSAIPRFLQQQYGLNRGSDRGRIWRLTAGGRAQEGQLFEKDLAAGSTVSEWVEWTQDVEAWRRNTAQRILVERRSTEAAALLRAKIRHDQSASGSLSAIYTLEGLGELSVQDLRIALASRFYEVRVHALRLAEGYLEHEGIRSQVVGMTHDSDSRVRLQLALSLGEMKPAAAIGPLLELIRGYADERWMKAAVLSSAREIAGPSLNGLLLDPSPSADLVTRWFSPLAATLAGVGDVRELTEVLQRALGHGAQVQGALLSGVLSGLEGSPPSGTQTAILFNVLGAYLRSESENVVELAVRLMVRLPGENLRELNALFARSLIEARDQQLAEPKRLHALRILESASFELVAPLSEKLMGPHESPAIQMAALSVLSSQSDVRTGSAILEGWHSYSPEMRAGVLEAIFHREDRVEALLGALETGQISMRDISARQRERLVALKNSDLSEKVDELLMSKPEVDSQELEIDRFQAVLNGARDPEKGQSVFLHFCAPCHRVGDEGFDVGPDLASIVGKPDEALLLDILNPNERVDPEYRSYSVETRSGEVYGGILAVDSPTSVTLREAQNVEHVILRRDIVGFRSSELSLMPANFGDVLAPEDMANLLSYLRLSFSR